jgi:hypothetical protein
VCPIIPKFDRQLPLQVGRFLPKANPLLLPSDADTPEEPEREEIPSPFTDNDAAYLELIGIHL